MGLTQQTHLNPCQTLNSEFKSPACSPVPGGQVVDDETLLERDFVPNSVLTAVVAPELPQLPKGIGGLFGMLALQVPA